MKLRVTRACEALDRKSELDAFENDYPDAFKKIEIQRDWEDFEQFGHYCKREVLKVFVEVNTLEELITFIGDVGNRAVIFKEDDAFGLKVYDDYIE